MNNGGRIGGNMSQGALFMQDLTPVKFFGSDITDKDTARLKGNLKKVFDALLKICWHTNEELFKATGMFCCDRYRRYIAEGRISGYGIEKKNFGGGVFKYKMIKICDWYKEEL